VNQWHQSRLPNYGHRGERWVIKRTYELEVLSACNCKGVQRTKPEKVVTTVRIREGDGGRSMGAQATIFQVRGMIPLQPSNLAMPRARCTVKLGMSKGRLLLERAAGNDMRWEF